MKFQTHKTVCGNWILSITDQKGHSFLERFTNKKELDEYLEQCYNELKSEATADNQNN